MKEVTTQIISDDQDGFYFNRDTCRFETTSIQDVLKNADKIKRPLSAILQITRRCNLDCVFCSEITPMPDPTVDQLRRMRDNLRGVPRLYITGGETTLREDLLEILDLFRGEFIIGLSTNACTPDKITPALKERIDFINIGLDGPRNVTSKVRGDYDTIMTGVKKCKALDIPITLCCVVLASIADAVPFACQTADVLEANKIKLTMPIPKGNALDLLPEEYMTNQEAESFFHHLTELKAKCGWRPKLAFVRWTPEVEGYSVLIYPNGDTFAWPVYDREDKVLLLGNVINESIEEIWARNPYKVNHLRKYLGASILVS